MMSTNIADTGSLQKCQIRTNSAVLEYIR